MDCGETTMQYISVEQTATALGVSVSSVRGWLRTGQLSGEQTIAGIWWISTESCRALIEERAGALSLTRRRFDAVLALAEMDPSPFEGFPAAHESVGA